MSATTMKSFTKWSALFLVVSVVTGCECVPVGKCGDATVNPGETCDDGNASSGDGCDESCHAEPGFSCVGSRCTPTCGDGVMTGTEACDDGNSVAGDGCASCAVEAGFTCTGAPSVCLGGCGDGRVMGNEACDDGNSAAGDGCASCALEAGFSCSGAPSVCVAGCGNGQVTAGEACDDGNSAAGDGCSPGCALENGFVCSGMPSVCVPVVCGDGVKQGSEACDDGNTSVGDGCSATCIVESGFTCTGTAPSVCATTCGDGVKAGAEACDDANTASGDGCSATCTVESGFSCAGTPSVCMAGCGDGIKAGGEGCDDGAMVDGDGCSATCRVESGFTCTGMPSTCVTMCGDGVKAGTETCDDGATVAGDGCSATCTTETGFTCTGTPSVCMTTCGDGVIGGTEQCDDGAALPGDGCSATCRPESGWTCSGLPSTCVTLCGDGLVAGTEQCDDGAAIPGDGCSATCTPEAGFTCTGMPSTCMTTCGDGVRAGAEACDDGNSVALDGCNVRCHVDVFDETEPNDTTAQANGPFNEPFIMRAAVQPAFDVDRFKLVLPTSTDLWLETTDETGTGCLNLDTVVTLFDAAGTNALAVDDDSGLDRCSKLDSRTDSRLVHLAAGTYVIEVTSYASFRVVPAYRLWVRFNAACGDGARTGTEQCDGTMGCDPTCRRVPTCGDGFIDGAERCDDGNTTPGDGCDASCAYEVQTETEMNGTSATANGPFTRNALIGGAISPATDLDFFAVTLTATSDLKLETFDSSGVTCNGIDTVLSLFAPDGTTLLVRADQGGLGNCASLDPSRQLDGAVRHLAAGTYFVKVEDALNDTVIPSYRLLVSRTAVCGNGVVEGAEECEGGTGCTATCDRVPVCGDGFVDSPETCDDGNALANDGCGATCLLEGSSETEPNDTPATATTIGAPFAQRRGSLSSGADLDWYSITLTSTSDLTVETSDGRGLGHCDRPLDTVLTLYAADGTTVLATEDDRGVDGCSRIDAKWDSGARRLAPGTYFVKVEDFGNNNPSPAYVVTFSLSARCGNGVLEGYETCDGTPSCSATCQLVATCGNGFVEAPETCDDSNVANSDGCSSTCVVETAETEPNATIAEAQALASMPPFVTGAITPAGDRDVFKYLLPSPTVLRIETFDASGANCLGLSTTLRVFDGAGTQLYTDDNSGISTCSALIISLPAGNFFIQVEQRGNTAVIPGYVLSVRTVTSIATETEANDTRATANGVGTALDIVVVGSHQSNVDSDFFSFTVPVGRSVRAELIEGSASETCESNGIDSLLTLYAPGGQLLGFDDDSGRGSCSRIDGSGDNAASPFASRLPGGVYSLQVEAAPFVQMMSNPAGQFDYRLVISIR